MDEMIKKALELGFTEVGWLDTSVIRFLPEVRSMCAAGRCGGYGTNWGCPPGCGDVNVCSEHVRTYPRGLVFTYAAVREDPFDYEAVEHGSKMIYELGYKLRDLVETEGKKRVWLMMPGPCKECTKCRYPDPCVNPGRATTSPEAQGMWVSEICRQASVGYNNGKDTITFVGLIFFDEV